MQQCAAFVPTQFYPKQLGAFTVVTLDTDAKTIWKGRCECKGEQEFLLQFQPISSFLGLLWGWLFCWRQSERKTKKYYTSVLKHNIKCCTCRQNSNGVILHLVFGAIRVNGEVANSFKLEFVKDLCSLDRCIHVGIVDDVHGILNNVKESWFKKNNGKKNTLATSTMSSTWELTGLMSLRKPLGTSAESSGCLWRNLDRFFLHQHTFLITWDSRRRYWQWIRFRTNTYRRS